MPSVGGGRAWRGLCAPGTVEGAVVPGGAGGVRKSRPLEPRSSSYGPRKEVISVGDERGEEGLRNEV